MDYMKAVGMLGGLFTGFVRGAEMHSQCPAYDSLARTMAACVDGDTGKLLAYLVGGTLLGTAAGAAADNLIHRINSRRRTAQSDESGMIYD